MKILPFFVIIPLGGAFIVSVFDFIKDESKKNRAADIFSAVIVLLTLILSIIIFAKTGIYNMGGWKMPIGVILVLDSFSSIMLVITNFISLMCVLFSFSYMEQYDSRERYYTLFLLMVAGMNGVVLTGDIFNLYVFLEVAAVASYALVGFGTKRQELEATFKYMVLSSIGTSFMLLGIALIYGHTWNLNMAFIAGILRNMDSFPPGIYLAAGLLVVGFSIKSALIPFHAWLPDAHPSAPAPISSMLSGVLIKTVGIYAMIRICYIVLGMNTGVVPQILQILGSLSIIVGVLLALGQWDFKRLLAYHSVSQMGYIALGFGLATPLGIIGALFHLLNHSVFKSLLFLNSGAVYYRVHTRDLRKMGGLARKMPVTGVTSMIASLSIAGIPPFSGFWSKFVIILACVASGHLWLAFWAVAGSILTLASFMKVQKYGFMGESHDKNNIDIKEVPFTMQLPMIILGVFCILMGLLFLPGVSALVLEPAASLIAEPARYLSFVIGKGL